jgi:hypothetical protein
MNQPSFKKIAQLSRESATIAKQNEEMHKVAMEEVRLKAQYLEIERMKFEADKHADIKHDLKQCIDFAINSLPWWRRSPRTVVDRATEFLLMLKRETAKHVAMDVLASKIREENKPIEQIKADTEKVLDGIMADRETAEMEIK